MVKVRFVSVNGRTKDVDGAAGDTVMQLARDNNVAEIMAACGGLMSCATCHVHIAPDWAPIVGPPSETEQTMLEMAIDTNENSRLSCQITLSDACDGLVVMLPESQI